MLVFSHTRSPARRAFAGTRRANAATLAFRKESLVPLAQDIDTKERIRQAVNLVDLVSATQGDVRRQGANFVCRCPWHDDRSPSLTINPARQSWKCWVCNI